MGTSFRNIEKRTWMWNEDQNSTPFKLGEEINFYLNKNLVKKSPDNLEEYTGLEGFPWNISAKNGRIESVFFRGKFFNLIEPNLWERQFSEIVKEVDNYLPSAEQEVEGDFLHIVFRDGFVSIVGFYRK